MAFLASFGPGTQVGRSPASAVSNQGLPIFDHIHEYVHSCRLCGFQSPSSGCAPRRGIERNVRGHRPRRVFVARIQTNGGGPMRSIPSRRSAAPAGLSPLHRDHARSAVCQSPHIRTSACRHARAHTHARMHARTGDQPTRTTTYRDTGEEKHSSFGQPCWNPIREAQQKRCSLAERCCLAVAKGAQKTEPWEASEKLIHCSATTVPLSACADGCAVRCPRARRCAFLAAFGGCAVSGVVVLLPRPPGLPPRRHPAPMPPRSR